MSRAIRAAALAAACAVLAGPGVFRGGEPQETGPQRIVRARYLMGTIFRFEAPAGRDPAVTAEALEDALDEVGRLEEILSNWRPESELSRLNARPGQGGIRVSAELFSAVAESLRWAKESQGAFDPTVEPLTRPFRGQSTGFAPAGTAGDRPRWSAVVLDPEGSAVALPAGSGLDLGGIGKGIALDGAAKLLAHVGVTSALLDGGGQLLAIGSPPGERGWRVAVADPNRRDRASTTFVLRDASAATSGNAERPGEILDPETGRPIQDTGSATAIAARATAADAFSTALFVLGPERGTAWARKRDDLLVLYLQPSSNPKSAPRARGTLPPAPEGSVYFIVGPQDREDRRLRVEVR